MDRGTLNSAKTAVTTATFGQDWNLDALGNWSRFMQDSDGNGTNEINQTRLHNAANEVTRIDGKDGSTLGGVLTPASGWLDPKNDRAGNTTVMPKPGAPTQGYAATYDAWNRLVKLSDLATSNTVATYEYDGMGWRIEKETPGASGEDRHFYYSSNWQIVEERTDAAGTDALVQYVWGIRYVDDLIARDRDANGGSTGDGTLEQRHYVLQDANFNATAIVDTAGDVVERHSYTPYGVRTVLDSNWALDADGVSDVLFTIGHQGLMLDTESGLIQNRNRVLHSQLGRFVQRDPLGYVDGANIYVYATSNPVTYTDPTGRDIWIQGPVEGEPYGHQSICVGAPDDYRSYSFGLDSKWQMLIPAPWRMGVIYEDDMGGQRVGDPIHTTPEQDAEAVAVLGRLVGQRMPYGLPYGNCRTFSSIIYQFFNELYGPPPPPPPPPQSPFSGPWIWIGGP